MRSDNRVMLGTEGPGELGQGDHVVREGHGQQSLLPCDNQSTWGAQPSIPAVGPARTWKALFTDSIDSPRGQEGR